MGLVSLACKAVQAKRTEETEIDTNLRARYTRDMLGISGEHIVILAIVLLLFGPRRLPELGNTLGKAMKNFKDSISGIEEAKFRKLDDKPLVAQEHPSEMSETKAEAKVGNDSPSGQNDSNTDGSVKKS